MRQHYTLELYPLLSNEYKPFTRRWFTHWLNPKNYYRTIKYLFQRGYRGYADCDSWDADSYLETIIYGVIKNLSIDPMGYPTGLVPEDAPDNAGFDTWKQILNEILVGLEASRDLRYELTIPDGIYSDEPLIFEDIPNSDSKRLVMTDTPRFNTTLYDEWAAPLLVKKKRAAHLLRKYWGCFWD